MLRAAEHVERTDTGRQRRENEDSYFARSPLFAIADGMGGAQAGEVASRVAVETLEPGLADGPEPAEDRLAELVAVANARVHEASQSGEGAAGMGTTLTAAYVDGERLALAHVGDSRAYRMRDGQLLLLSEDHTLVEELVRQGRLTAEEAQHHPQRSIITRALGIEDHVEVDRRSWPALAGDIYLLCSDGLTSMIEEHVVADILRAGPTLTDAARKLIEAANNAGGKDNITVVLFRLEQVEGTAPADDPDTEQQTIVSDRPALETVAAATAVSTTPPDAAAETQSGAEPAEPPEPAARDSATAPVARRTPRLPAPDIRRRARGPRARRALVSLAILALVIVPIVIGVEIALQSVYFVGTDSNGYIAVYQGVPYSLPAGIHLYTPDFISGINAQQVPPAQLKRLLNHKLRTHSDALSLVRQLELGELR